MKGKEFENELSRLQLELVRMLDWVRGSGHRLVVLFEGRVQPAKGARSSASPSPSTPESAG